MDQQVAAMEDYLRFWRSHVMFLPFSVPEEEVWDDVLVENELKDVINDKEQIQAEKDTLAKLDPKQRFAYLVERVYGRNRAENIMTVQSKFVRNWIMRNPPAVEKVKNMLFSLRQTLSEQKAN